ncbi:uncharacterized protein [Prorops nasuta]|uniref:uncharacterized protein n=1 Tax=Prorops nasuta TaxID=863751 RepID=UPI0034CDA0CB
MIHINKLSRYKDEADAISAILQLCQSTGDMLVTVLPFFLAANILDDGDPMHELRWQNKDPEFTYDVLINMNLHSQNNMQNVSSFCSVIRTNLKCRPKGSDTLFCRFHLQEEETRNQEKRFHLHDSYSPSSTGKNIECKKRETNDLLMSESFEIRFNPRGVENLVIDRNISRWNLDTIKLIVTQLHHGINLDLPRKDFTTLENSTNGYCDVAVKVTQKKESFDVRTAHFDDFEISLDPLITKYSLDQSNEYFIIQKTRNPNKCLGRQMYFLGKHRNLGIIDQHTTVIMNSSVSRMVVSKFGFSSYTISEGVINHSNATFYPSQKISVILKNVAPVQNEFVDIPNPASTSIHYLNGKCRHYKIRLRNARRRRRRKRKATTKTAKTRKTYNNYFGFEPIVNFTDMLTIIPFFLAGAITWNGTLWQYGPEYLYDVTANVTLADGDPNNQNYLVSSMTASLKCRPKPQEDDRLVCQLKDAIVRKTPIRSTGVIITIRQVDWPFEIQFSKRGVESIMVQTPISNWMLNIIRSIAGQLSIGIDLHDVKNFSTPIKAKENFVFGQCLVTYNISQYFVSMLVKDFRQLERKLEQFRPIIIPLEKTPVGWIQSIVKTRNPSKCEKHSEQLFGGFANAGLMRLQTVSSTSRITVQETFKSETLTESKVITIDGDRGKSVLHREFISVALREVVPAKEKLLTIPDAVTTNIFNDDEILDNLIGH